MIPLVRGSLRNVWWSNRRNRSFGCTSSRTSCEMILSAAHRVRQHTCRGGGVKGGRTPEELAVVRDPPAAALEGPVGREAHHGALHAREHLVEVRDVCVQLVERLPDLLREQVRAYARVSLTD